LYVELVRGIPLLVQLLYWYYAFPSIVHSLGAALNLPVLENYRANAVAMAVLGMTFCYGAYMTEIYRAGIQSIPKGQLEAARSLGMSYVQAMRHVVLPQAIRVILPPGNQFIGFARDSSLARSWRSRSSPGAAASSCPPPTCRSKPGRWSACST
jgi:polar amino acid transport system permease protein